MSADKKRRWTPLFIAIAVILLALSPILYALSVGPAMWVASRGYITFDRVVAIYNPLFDFCGLFPGGDDTLRQYIAIWWNHLD
jgi:hypothetical protein